MFGYYGVVAVLWAVLGLLWPEGLGSEWAPPFVPQLAQLAAAAAIANGIWVLAKWRTGAWMGWPGVRRSTVWFGWGSAIGLGMAAAVLFVGVAFGGARVGITGEPVSAYAFAALGVTAGLAVAALAEELLFRGFPLARLAEVVGPVPASAGLALLFALAHLANPEVTGLGLANIALASLVLSAAFFTPGGLPAAWGLHLGWNWGLGVGADAPVSGVGFELPALEYGAGTAAWLTGGDFGPEGGVASTLVMAGVTILLARSVLRRRAMPDRAREGTT